MGSNLYEQEHFPRKAQQNSAVLRLSRDILIISKMASLTTSYRHLVECGKWACLPMRLSPHHRGNIGS